MTWFRSLIKHLNLLGLVLILCSCQEYYFKGPKSEILPSDPASIPSTTPTPPLERDLDKSWAPHSADLLGYYRIQGTDGDIIPDQNEDITATGPLARVVGSTAAIASAPTNKAIVMNGTYVELNGAGASMHFGNNLDFSIQSWVKFSGTSTWGRVISNGFHNNTNGFGIQVSPDMSCGERYYGAFLVGIGAENIQTFQNTAMVQTSPGYNDDQWHHLVAVFNQSTATKTMTVYIDGLKTPITKPKLNDGACGNYITTCGTITSDVLDFSACLNVSAGDAWGQTFIGHGRWGMYDPFPGSLAEVAIWGVPLTASEVDLIYQRQR